VYTIKLVSTSYQWTMQKVLQESDTQYCKTS